MSTAIAPTESTLERPQEHRGDAGDHDRFQHYFRKDDVTRNLLTGEPMTALCGKVVKRQVDPKGRTVCPTCAELMDSHVGSNLPPDDRGEAPTPL